MPDRDDDHARRPERDDPLVYQRFALPFYDGKDAAHDAQHIRRIFGRLPTIIDETESTVRYDCLWFLAAFHGLARRSAEDRAFRRQAEGFLATVGWNPEELDDLFGALGRHTSDPQSLEEHLVHDANALEVVGAFGIAKTFLKGGYEHQSYEETVELYRRFLDEVRFFTPTAREIAQARREFAEAFLNQFSAEAAIDPALTTRTNRKQHE